jgi:hypothetical protein
LAYIIPIVDRVLREGSGKGIKAIVLYPMNARANSQFGELEKFQRPGEQLRKVAAALEQAKIKLAVSQPPPEPPADSDVSIIERETNHDDTEEPTETLAVPYAEARFAVPRATQPHELAAQQMVDVLLRIVQVEGPVHEDELTARVRDLWGSAVQAHAFKTASLAPSAPYSSRDVANAKTIACFSLKLRFECEAERLCNRPVYAKLTYCRPKNCAQPSSP